MIVSDAKVLEFEVKFVRLERELRQIGLELQAIRSRVWNLEREIGKVVG